ncbi:hemin uptake protein HemP [Escherichia coli]|nr:hemin uptake protein HemP [Escherichia coli]
MRYTDSRKLTPETDANHKTASPQPIRRISSQTLLGPDGKLIIDLIIDHDGQEYLLRKTQAGKLLLTK